MAWDYTDEEYQKQAKDPLWQLERCINYGCNEKLNAEEVKKYLPQLKIDPKCRALLNYV